MATVAESGLKDLSWAALDTDLAVSAGGLITTAALKDLLDGTSGLLPDKLFFNFAITNVGTTDGFDLNVYALFSEVGTDTVDQDSERKKILIANLKETGAGDDLTMSNIYSVSVLSRYFGLVYLNNNTTDAVTVTSRVASRFWQTYAV